MAPRCDVLIAGGGIAACATAIPLARAGRSVVVVERTGYGGPRVGEMLPPTANLALKRLGLWDRFVKAGHAPAPAVLIPRGNGKFEAKFELPQRSIAPGQAVVFYRGDSVLGGGWIEKGFE